MPPVGAISGNRESEFNADVVFGIVKLSWEKSLVLHQFLSYLMVANLPLMLLGLLTKDGNLDSRRTGKICTYLF